MVEASGVESSMPEPVDFEKLGPEVGERFPEVRLEDQSGQVLDLHQDRGERAAVVVYYRSVRW
jgi:hypothetical protein